MKFARWTSLLLSGLTVLAFVVLTTCGKDSATKPQAPDPSQPPPPANPVATRISITPSSVEMNAIGETVRLTAKVFDQNSNVMSGAPVTWQNSDTDVATVNAQGLVTAVGNGRSTVTTRSGNASAMAAVTVMQSARRITIEPTTATLFSLGQTVLLTATVLDGNDQPVTDASITWQSENPEVATVSDAGLVTAVLSGTTTITARSGDLSDSSEIYVQGPESDRAFLIAFYDALDGPNWINAANWKSKTPLGQWYGVLTNAEGRVTALNLGNNGLSGVIPPETGHLAALEGLALDGNRLTGSIPPELGLLSNLKHLYLFSNQLIGVIPSELGNLANLLHLCLDRNRFTGTVPEELGSLTNLKWLHLFDNFDLSGPLPESITKLQLLELLIHGTQLCVPTTEPFEEWLEGILDKQISSCEKYLTDRDVLVTLYKATNGPGWLDNMNWLSDRPLGSWYGVETKNDKVIGLWLGKNNLSGILPPELSQLQDVTNLSLYNNELTGNLPHELGLLSELKSLQLSKNQLAGNIPPQLGQLKKLETLSLSENRLGGPIPPELSKLSNLISLQLSGNALTGSIPSKFGQLSSLESLSLNDNVLTGCLPSEVGRLRALRQLRLNDNKLTCSLPFEIGQLKNLKTLILYNNEFTGTIPPEIGMLSALNWLWLSSNQLTGAIPPELGLLQNLTDLRFYDNRLTGIIPPEIGMLSNLNRLWLSSNQLTGAIPPELGNLLNLTDVSIRFNMLTGEIPPELGRLLKLTYLSFNTNKLTGSVPAELGNLTKLEVLDLTRNATLLGPLPVALTNLANLRGLYILGTQLCLPSDEAFTNWLDKISRTEVVQCDDASTDRDVLAVLYNRIGGPSWTNNSNWLSDQPLSHWYGVTTGQSGRVEAIDLGNNNLRGLLPAKLSNLDDLRRLKLDDNPGLTGPLPIELTKLNLESLSISGTALCIPSDDTIQAWFRKVSVDSVSNCIVPSTDREVLITLFHSTDGDNWTKKTNWLSDLPLDQWHGVATDVSGRVTRLDLNDNNLNGDFPSVLAQLDNLISLSFGSNQLSGDIPPELGQLSKLVRLSLNINRLSGVIPPELGQLSMLESLDLRNNQLSGVIPPELGHLSKLRTLLVDSNQLSGSLPSELGRLTNLVWLLIHTNGISGVIPPELGKLSQLELLNLSSNQLTGGIPEELGQLINVESLSFDNNRLTDSIPPEMAQLINIESLSLGNNQLSGVIPPELGHLSKLESLDLSSNQLTGGIPKELSQLANLRYFNITGTKVCVPRNPDFQTWFYRFPSHQREVSSCPLMVNLEESTAYLTQSVQSFKYPVSLVANEPALLRVFLTSDGTVANKPALKAIFYNNGTEVHSAVIPSGGVKVPDSVDESSLFVSSNVVVPGDVISPGLEFVVNIGNEGDQLAGFGSMGRIPVNGMIKVDVLEMPVFDLTMVPLLWNEEPDYSIVFETEDLTAESDLFRLTRDLLPVKEFSLTVREPVYVSSDPVFRSDHAELLGEVEAIRTMDGASGYYMGVLKGGGGFGFASRPGVVSSATLDGFTIAHELGHNLSLGHAPCNEGLASIGFLDPGFPYADGNIGAWGFDLLSNALVYPETPDLMSYCDPVWISDYHFEKMIRYRLTEEEERLLATGPPLSKSLLLWGGLSLEDGLYLEPAFVVDAPASLPNEGGPYRLQGHDESGIMLFELDFVMGEIADGEGGVFVYALPVQQEWSGSLARITLTGPEGFVEVTQNSGRSASLLLDPSTGRVRGILRNWPEPGAPTLSARRLLPESNLDVVISRGIPNVSDW